MSTGAVKRWALALTSLAAFIVAMDSQIMTIALATIRTDLHASIESLQWTVNAYMLTFSVLLLAGAALGDRFGRRRIFMAGIALFVAASASCALAPDATALTIARAIQGVGGAMIMPLAITLLSVAFPPAERGKAIGTFTAVIGLSLIAGPVLGGAITQQLSWHAIFWLNVPLGIIVLPLIRAYIGESTGETARFDLAGLLLVTAAALGLVWGLVRAANHGWSDTGVSAALVSGGIVLAIFVAWEARAQHPMIPLRLFASHAFSAGNGASFLFNAAVYGTLFFLPQFLQTAQHDSALVAGLRMLPWSGTLFVFAPIAGALIDRVGERAIVVAGLALQVLGNVWLALIATPALPYAHLIAPLVLAGSGVSLAMPATQRAILNAAPRADVGKASGTFTMVRYLGGIFGVAILAAVFSRYGAFSTANTFGAGFAPVMWGAALFSLLALAAGALLPAAPPETVTAVSSVARAVPVQGGAR